MLVTGMLDYDDVSEDVAVSDRVFQREMLAFSKRNNANMREARQG
jgi:hypothetical protein